MKQKPGSRREGRLLAVQLLFMLDHNSTPFEEAWPGFLAFRKDDDELLVNSDKSRDFCEQLVRGAVEHWAEIERRIKESTANFALHRIGGVERAILRLAIHEMLHCLETPPVVAINEALELAKRLAGDEAARFINGVLDKIRGTLTRPSRTAAVPVTYVPPGKTYSPLELMEEQMKQAARELGERSGDKAQEYAPGDSAPEQS